ncbi:MAG TPA: hypothetical protein VKU41_06125 [Polyangiaceae bacterium]|nr:hypothetical protein [Polyangiaceae bacterium]
MTPRWFMFVALLAAANTDACAATDRRFTLRDPLTVDTDLLPVQAACHEAPSDKDANHVSCAPREYVSPLIWDGADNLVFRPFAELWGFRASTEAANANSLDEVADSSWFTNRIGVRPMSLDELGDGACDPAQMLDPDHAADGSWLVDKGKTDGSSLGFRVNIGGKKYLFKVDTGAPERSSAASVIGAAAYHAVGFYTSCEQVVYFRPSLLRLKPGLRFKGNFGAEADFDRAALDHIVSLAPRDGDKVRFQASAWLPGQLLGPFRYVGTRSDDPNDIIPHEERRELRGGRILAAWLDHFDAREQNSMDSWISERPEVPDSSPGHVLHYYLDTSDCLGSEWDWEQITRRLGYSYVVDWSDIGRDFVTLGIPLRPWDRVRRAPGHESFNYFDVANFDPDRWKNEYANPAFDRMTERDAAWMARILSGFTPELVQALASMGKLQHPADTEFLAGVLEGRLERILERYLTRLSPIASLHVEGGTQLCGVDLAERRRLRSAQAFRYAARVEGGGWLPVSRRPSGEICATMPHVASDDGWLDHAADRYVRVVIQDGVARGSVVAHLYDLGRSRGYRLAGVERPEP